MSIGGPHEVLPPHGSSITNNSDPWKRELIQRFPNCAKVEGLLWIGVTRDPISQRRATRLSKAIPPVSTENRPGRP